MISNCWHLVRQTHYRVAFYTSLVLHDGVCNFCNHSVQTILALDSDRRFHFCSLQSNKGKILMEKVGSNNEDLSSVVYMEVTNIDSDAQPVVVYYKSDAVIEISRRLGFFPRLGANILSLLPKHMRDDMYDFVGRNRYRVFGKSDVCQIPRKEDAHRFLK